MISFMVNQPVEVKAEEYDIDIILENEDVSEEDKEMLEETIKVADESDFDFSQGYENVAEAFIASAMLIAAITKSKAALDLVGG